MCTHEPHEAMKELRQIVVDYVAQWRRAALFLLLLFVTEITEEIQDAA